MIYKLIMIDWDLHFILIELIGKLYLGTNTLRVKSMNPPGIRVLEVISKKVIGCFGF